MCQGQKKWGIWQICENGEISAINTKWGFKGESSLELKKER